MSDKGRLYGWQVIAAAWLAVFCLFGYRSTFSILKVPMSAEMGWSQAQVSLGYSIMMGVYAVCAFVSGFIVDKWGTKPIYWAGAALGMAGFYVTAQSHSLSSYYASFGILAGVATAGLWTGSIVAARQWFVGASYAKMWGIAFSGGPIAQIVLSLFIKHQIAGGDPTAWRGAMEILGGLVLVLLIIAAVLAKNPPEKYGLKPIGVTSQAAGGVPATRGEAYASYPFWAVVLVFVCCTLGEFQIWTQLVSYWTSDLKMSLGTATNTYIVIGIVGIFSMPIMGWVADRVVGAGANEARGRKIMLIVGPLVGVAACALLLMQTADAPIFGFAFCVLFAIYWAIVPGGVVGYLGAIFGRGALGSIYSLVALICMGGGPFVGPLVGGYLKDVSGGYTYSMAFSLCAFLLAALIAFSLPLSLKKRQATAPVVGGAATSA